jgi:alginate O-acetyltransferase complex protein AlgI
MTLAGAAFIMFLAAVYLLWRFAIPGESARKNFLLFASYVFYCTWDAHLAVVLILTTVVQWWLGSRIETAASVIQKRRLVGVSVAYGLTLLGYFKYAGFFLDSLKELLSNIGFDTGGMVLDIAAPIGISFYTFQSLTYTLDIYRGHERATRNLRDFALFLAFFPHVTAGPIARARRLLPQLDSPSYRGPLEAEAVYLLARGLVKKIAIADVLAAQFVQPAFGEPGAWSATFLLVAVAAYSFQIYMDLSGYTDLARGAARLFGYQLDINFDRPYLSRTVSNFWQRWHISMSSFFREYLYFSLGGTRRGNVYVNLMVTFIAIGMWHGAGWNFIVYGFVHGSMVCFERLRRTHRVASGLAALAPGKMAALAGLLKTFVFVALARVLFVESDLGGALEFFSRLVAPTGAGGAAGAQGYVTLAIAALLHVLPRSLERRVALSLFSLPSPVQAVGMVGLTYMLVVLASDVQPFVYFRF